MKKIVLSAFLISTAIIADENYIFNSLGYIPMEKASVSTDFGGNKQSIDAYSDGAGVVIYGTDLSTGQYPINTLVFQYGDAALSNNANLLDYIIANGNTQADKDLAANIQNAITLSGIKNQTQNPGSCDTGYSGNPYSGDIFCDNQSPTVFTNNWLNLKSVSGSLWFSGIAITNQDLNNLSNLTSVGGPYGLYLADGVFTNVDALNSLRSVDSSNSPGAILSITNNQELLNLNGLSNLQDGGINLQNLSKVATINLQKMQKANRILISDLPSLISVQSLGSLHSVNKISINNTPNLNNITGLSTINTIEDNYSPELWITGTKLTNLNALQNLQNMYSLNNMQPTITLDDNIYLTDISGLKNITSPNGYMSVSNSGIITGKLPASSEICKTWETYPSKTLLCN